MIISEQFTAERDTSGWTLTQKVPTEKREAKKAHRLVYTYWSRFEHLCSYILDVEIGQCETIAEVLSLLRDRKGELEEIIKLRDR